MPGIMNMPDSGNTDYNTNRCFFMPMPINYKDVIYTLKGTYTQTGTYSINNCKIGTILIFGMGTESTGTSDSYIQFSIKSGSLIGTSNQQYAYSFGRSSNSTLRSNCSCIIIPTENTISFTIDSLNGKNTKLYVYGL